MASRDALSTSSQGHGRHSSPPNLRRPRQRSYPHQRYSARSALLHRQRCRVAPRRRHLFIFFDWRLDQTGDGGGDRSTCGERSHRLPPEQAASAPGSGTASTPVPRLTRPSAAHRKMPARTEDLRSAPRPPGISARVTIQPEPRAGGADREANRSITRARRRAPVAAYRGVHDPPAASTRAVSVFEDGPRENRSGGTWTPTVPGMTAISGDGDRRH